MSTESAMDVLFDKEVKCPVCDNTYLTKKIKTSKIAVLKKHLDFYTEYRYGNPSYYAIFVCPFCGYASFESDFNKISNEESTLIRRRVTSLWNSKDYGGYRTPEVAADTYKLAYICYKLRKTDNVVFAKIALKLSHIYRDVGDRELVARYEKMALDYFNEAYLTGVNYSDGEELDIKFMIAELNHKCGNYSEAFKWFALLLKDRRVRTKPIMEKNAHQIVYEMREELSRK